MNKYEYALNTLCTYSDGNPSSAGEFVGKILQEADDTLQELVGKATPKKVVKRKIEFDSEEEENLYIETFGEEQYFYTTNCPFCDQILVVSFRYCPDCGQALDWSE